LTVESGEVVIDKADRAEGRGIYFCPRLECFKLGLKKRVIERSLKVKLSELNRNKIEEDIGQNET
jgi:predicted RNA-binding protein YlxR (DUF448 family)